MEIQLELPAPKMSGKEIGRISQQFEHVRRVVPGQAFEPHGSSPWLLYENGNGRIPENLEKHGFGVRVVRLFDAASGKQFAYVLFV